MKLFRTKIWCWYDIAFLKWSSLLFGVAGGAYFADFLKPYVTLCLVVAVIFAIRPAVVYFKGSD
jgi:hypothetical protein